MEVVYWGERVKVFIRGVNEEVKIEIGNVIDLLIQEGHLIEMPDSKSLGKGLFELRVQGRLKVRILYIFHNNKAYILHAFIKKTWKIPLNDIRYARQVQKEIIRLA